MLSAARGSWDERGIVAALRSTYRAGLSKQGKAKHAFVVEGGDGGSERGDDIEDDPEVVALLADHGCASTDAVIEEEDVINALVGWKEQRKKHKDVKLGRGFVKPDLNKYRSRVRCHNCKKIGHFQKDCREPRKLLSAPPPVPGDKTEGKPKTSFFVGFTDADAALTFDEMVEQCAAARVFT